MKNRLLIVATFLVLVIGLTACSGNTAERETETTENTQSVSTESPDASEILSDGESDAVTESETVSESDTEDDGEQGAESEEAESNILIAYFSRAGENYSVGVIEKGNTEIIAEMIADQTGGELFKIERDTPYPESYDECTDEASREQTENARPALAADLESIDDYDIIFVGYPIWWGDMPMPVYTFLESHDFSGKTVIPFCTHEGSGLSSTVSSIEDVTGATVLDGLAVRGSVAQNSQEEAEAAVTEWLADILE